MGFEDYLVVEWECLILCARRKNILFHSCCQLYFDININIDWIFITTTELDFHIQNYQFSSLIHTLTQIFIFFTDLIFFDYLYAFHLIYKVFNKSLLQLILLTWIAIMNSSQHFSYLMINLFNLMFIHCPFDKRNKNQ